MRRGTQGANEGFLKKERKLKNLGIEYDEEALASGEYDDILIADKASCYDMIYYM